MFAKLLAIVLAAKSGALSGVLLVAGVAVSMTASSVGATLVVADQPSPAPSVEVTAGLPPATDDETAVVAPARPHEEDVTVDRGLRSQRTKSVSAPACEVADAERAEARERVAAAFAHFRDALDELRHDQRAARAGEALTEAEQMLRDVGEKTDRALAELCEDESVSTVTDRAITAMETIANLATSAATATPIPKPAARPTPKPPTPKPVAKQAAKPAQQPVAAKPQWTPKPPRCDDKLYANKLVMAAAFERYHSINDKLYYAIKRSSSEWTKAVVLSNDQLMHQTYERAKQEILSSGCTGDFGAAAAARAAATFERAYLSSAAAVIAEQQH